MLHPLKIHVGTYINQKISVNKYNVTYTEISISNGMGLVVKLTMVILKIKQKPCSVGMQKLDTMIR